MSIGASSACFYPMETEKAFLRIAELGFKHSEIFFNSSCELKSSFVKELWKDKNKNLEVGIAAVDGDVVDDSSDEQTNNDDSQNSGSDTE